MKTALFVAFLTVLSLHTGSSFAGDDRQAAEAARKQAIWEQQNGNRSTIISRHNSHVTREGYAPSDLVEQGRREGVSCDEHGNLGVSSSTGYCRNFKSRSEGSQWRIRFANQHGGTAERVFKLTNGQPTLWVKYNPGNQRVEYASAGAQQYAASHGGGQYAKGNQPAQGQQQQAANGGQCDHLSGKMRAGCEAAALVPGLGDFFKR